MFYLAKYAPVLGSLCVIDSSYFFSPLGLVALIEQCTHLSYLHLENTLWTRQEFSQFLTLDLREPRNIIQSVLGTNSPFSYNKNMRGGMCLQYLSIATDEATAVVEDDLFSLAKERFPTLKTCK